MYPFKMCKLEDLYPELLVQILYLAFSQWIDAYKVFSQLNRWWNSLFFYRPNLLQGLICKKTNELWTEPESSFRDKRYVCLLMQICKAREEFEKSMRYGMHTVYLTIDERECLAHIHDIEVKDYSVPNVSGEILLFWCNEINIVKRRINFDNWVQTTSTADSAIAKPLSIRLVATFREKGGVYDSQDSTNRGSMFYGDTCQCTVKTEPTLFDIVKRLPLPSRAKAIDNPADFSWVRCSVRDTLALAAAQHLCRQNLQKAVACSKHSSLLPDIRYQLFLKLDVFSVMFLSESWTTIRPPCTRHTPIFRDDIHVVDPNAEELFGDGFLRLASDSTIVPLPLPCSSAIPETPLFPQP